MNELEEPYRIWLELMMPRRRRRGHAMTSEEKKKRQRERYRLLHPPKAPGPYGRHGSTREERTAYHKAYREANKDILNHKAVERYNTDDEYRARRVQIQRDYRERKKARNAATSGESEVE